MYSKVCRVCEKNFKSQTAYRTTCSEECRRILKKESIRNTYANKSRGRQLCESCQRATGLVIDKIVCPWAKCLHPVKGWDAKPIVIQNKDDLYESYDIKSCPIYLQDEPRRRNGR